MPSEVEAGRSIVAWQQREAGSYQRKTALGKELPERANARRRGQQTKAVGVEIRVLQLRKALRRSVVELRHRIDRRAERRLVHVGDPWIFEIGVVGQRQRKVTIRSAAALRAEPAVHAMAADRLIRRVAQSLEEPARHLERDQVLHRASQLHRTAGSGVVALLSYGFDHRHLVRQIPDTKARRCDGGLHVQVLSTCTKCCCSRSKSSSPKMRRVILVPRVIGTPCHFESSNIRQWPASAWTLFRA